MSGSVHGFRKKSRASIVGPHQECVVTAVHEGGGVEVELTSGGEPLTARCPQHIAVDWLRAALLIAPVDALVLCVDGMRPVLWGIFPDARHEGVRAPVRLHATSLELDATDGVEIHSGDSRVTLKANGRVVLRGHDVVSRSSGSNRLKGARVRIN